MAALKRLPPSAATNDLLSFHESFWGNPLPKEHVTLKANVRDVRDGAPGDEDGSDESDGDLLPNPIFKNSLKNLLIRSEYLRIYEYVANADLSGKNLAVVTGQPGIGKCCVTI